MTSTDTVRFTGAGYDFFNALYVKTEGHPPLAGQLRTTRHHAAGTRHRQGGGTERRDRSLLQRSRTNNTPVYVRGGLAAEGEEHQVHRRQRAAQLRQIFHHVYGPFADYVPKDLNGDLTLVQDITAAQLQAAHRDPMVRWCWARGTAPLAQPLRPRPGAVMDAPVNVARPTTLPDSIAGRMLRRSTYGDVDEALRSPILEQVSHPRADQLATGTRVDFPLGGSLQSLDGRAHLERRRAYAPLFRKAMLATYEFDHLVPTLRRRLAELRTTTPATEVTADIVPLMRSAALSVTAAVIGLDETGDPARERVARNL